MSAAGVVWPTPLHAAGAGDPYAAWSADPLALALLAGGAALFVAGWARLRRRAGPARAGVGRLGLFAGGLALVMLAVLSPLDRVAEEYLLTAHMAQHLLIADLAPLLIALAVSGPLALFVVPRPILRAARGRRVRAALGGLSRPAVALALWGVVMVAWHVPGLYELALRNRAVHDLEHATMFAAGLLLWLHIAGALPRARTSRAGRAGMALVAVGIGMVVSQYLFISDPLYATYIDQAERLFGLSPRADQVQAAMFMTAEQVITFGTAAGLLIWAHVERASAPAAGGGDPPAAPERAP